MIHYLVSVQTYLTFQARSNETGTRGKPCGLKRLMGGDLWKEGGKNDINGCSRMKISSTRMIK